MFTSRVEYRLILREDNADLRLRKIGYEAGLVGEREYKDTQKKSQEITEGISFLKGARIKPTQEVNLRLTQLKSAPIRRSVTLEELLRRPQISLSDIKNLDHVKLNITERALTQVEIGVKYSGFIERQLKDVERFMNLEKIKLPHDLEYKEINGLSREIKEKLNKFRPFNLGQASRISGVTPAAISLLMVYLRKVKSQKT